MSRHTTNSSRGPRTGLIALTGVAAVAIAGTAAWMTLGGSSMSTAANPAAISTSPAPAQPQTPASTPAQPAPVPAAAVALAAASHAAVLPAAPAAASTAPAGTSAPGAAGQQAFVDPKTGKLRPAEHDEVAALNAAPAGARRLARTAQVAAPQEFATEGGAMGIAVPDEVQPYTVATKTPDGRIVLEHVTGGKAAAAKVRANTKPGVSPVSQARKGEPNDR